VEYIKARNEEGEVLYERRKKATVQDLEAIKEETLQRINRVLVWKEHAETAKARDKQRQTLLESGTLKN